MKNWFLSFNSFYFILFYFILFYFILFYFILFYFILFYSILFYFILFYFISILFLFYFYFISILFFFSFLFFFFFFSFFFFFLLAQGLGNATDNYFVPVCVPDVQNGFCQVQTLRKPQNDFSWDWGPGNIFVLIYGVCIYVINICHRNIYTFSLLSLLLPYF